MAAKLKLIGIMVLVLTLVDDSRSISWTKRDGNNSPEDVGRFSMFERTANYIVNGRPGMQVFYNELKFIGIMRQDDQFNYPLCGVTILDRYWAMTSASCVQK